MTLLEALKKLQTEGHLNDQVGICGHLEYIYEFDFSHHKLKDIFKRWPKFSGDINYPVPAVYCYNPDIEYNHSSNLWIGAYGDLRKELLQFCIDELSKEQQ